MKGASDITNGIHCIKQAYEHFASFEREYPGSVGRKILGGYRNKLEWFYKDLITKPSLPDIVREGVRHEWNSDVFIISAIQEKMPLLTPEQRTMVETLIDAMIDGEDIELIQTEDAKTEN